MEIHNRYDARFLGNSTARQTNDLIDADLRANGPSTATEIATRIAVTRETVRVRCTRMAQAGHLNIDRSNRYHIATHSTDKAETE